MKTLVTTLAILAIIFAGCGKDDDPVPNPPPPPPPPPPPTAPADTLLNWKRVTTGLQGFKDVWFTNAQTGYLLANDGLYHTTDEGKTWNKRVSKTDMYNLFFLNAQYGYVQGMEFGYTTDGGLTWVLRPNPVFEYRDLFFTTPSTGYATSLSGLYKTSDTGKTWQKIRTGVSNGIFFFDASNGWINEAGKFYKTSDAGTTWQYVSEVSPSNMIYIPSFQFTDALHAKFASTNIFAISNDGGLTWTTKTFPGITDKGILDIHFLSNDIGYLCTDTEIFKTTDGGNTWTRSAKILGSGIVELHFTGTNTGWACGINSDLFQLK